MKPATRYLTIFADASYHREGAGWGCWIKGEGAPISYGAPFKEAMGSSLDAEVCALANAIAIAHALKLIAPGMVVMLQSDCIGALIHIRRAIPWVDDSPVKGGCAVGRARKPLKHPLSVTAIARIKGLLEGQDVKVLTRHVFGHTQGNGRFYVNRHCDQLARRGSRGIVTGIGA